MAIQDEIDIGIITAPRELPTLDYSIKSLRKYLPNCYLNIFAEPGRLETEAYKMNILVNREVLGALHNYNNALNWILKHGEKPYIWITEDDYVYNSLLVRRLDEVLSHDKEFGYFNLFTNYWNPALPNPMTEGWADLRLGYWDAWGMNYVMRRDVARRLVVSKTWNEYLNTTNKNIDGAISETFKQMDLPMWFHNPSPSCTCGIISTLGHECKTDGLHFKLNL
jgi:hypothetical protein